MYPRIVILGAGISGLATAFRLRERLPDAELTILDAATQPGGMVGTETIDGFRVERGPNGIFDANPAGVQLCRDLGLGDRLISGSDESRRNRFLFLSGRLQKLPASPFGILQTPILSLRGRLALIAEPLKRRRLAKADESITAFARRRFGREAAATFVDGLVTGIYAGDPERLSLPACFPRLAKYEAESGSILRGVLAARRKKKREARQRGEAPPGPPRMWSFREGLQVLVETLRERVGSDLKLGVRVTRLERTGSEWTVHGDGNDRWQADQVILTIPARPQADLVSWFDEMLAAGIRTIRSNRIVVVALGYRRDQVHGPQEGFGYIAPQNSRRDVLGVQWCSSIFPERAPPGFVLWRALCGGVQRGEMVDWPDEQLLACVHREVARAMMVQGDPVFHRIIRWSRAIPQYELGHLARLKVIDHLAAQWPGLHLSGKAYRGVALADCAEQAALLADRISGTVDRKPAS
jgi:oxygen-dependent protoporphyrinogen oxidase